MTEYKFTANYKPVEEQPIVISFDELHKELYDRGWTVHWEFNSAIDPLLKYNHCVTYLDCREIEPEVVTDVDENGAWNYRLDNLETGGTCEADEDGMLTIVDTLFYDKVNLEDIQENNGLKSFNVPLPKLADGTFMFYGTALQSFSGDLPNLTNGVGMFFYCSALESFSGDLTSLTHGSVMFSNCTALTSFSGDLQSLTNGEFMFGNCTALTTFDSDLSSLTDSTMMFSQSALESFNVDLPKLTNGYSMFFRCTALTTFDSDLSSLTNGMGMFYECILNSGSVQNIAETINDLSDDTNDGSDYWGEIYIGIGNSTPNTEEAEAFNTMASKGWSVYVNGRYWSSAASTSSTNLTEEEQSTSIPFYAKPIEVTEEHADYTSSDGKFYSIIGAQFIYGDDLSTYGAFTSFEHAQQEIMLDLNLTKIEKSNLSNLFIKR